jgi:NAD(P)-dependent dehydrogenase (short-subunit alcohol dehydrogenase family)
MLARHGAKVFLTDLDEAGGRAAGRTHQCGAPCHRGLVGGAGRGLEARWQSVLAEANAAMGGISVLVNNAGIGALGGVESLEPKEWQRVMSVNVDAVYYGCKYALPLLRENQPASIINISSLAAFKVDPELHGLQHRQGRGGGADQIGGHRLRAAEDRRPLQLGAPRVYSHRHRRAVSLQSSWAKKKP